MSSETFYAVARVEEIADGSGIAVEVAGLPLAVFRDGDHFYATDDSCPHQGMPLSDGLVCDKTLTCSWHGWRFSLEDGRWLDSPKSRTRVATYPVRVVEDRVEVGIPG